MLDSCLGGAVKFWATYFFFIFIFQVFLKVFFFIMRKSKMSLRPSSGLGRGWGPPGEETASPPEPVAQFPGFSGTVPCFLLRFDPCASAVGKESFSFYPPGSLAGLINRLT